MAFISSSCRRVVVGLGKTGMSCVRYLAREGLPFSVIDSRVSPPGIEELYENYPDVPVFLGGFDQEVLESADELIVSPGVALAQPEIAAAIAIGVNAVGDIELFCRAIGDTPVVAITGSNGKSTATTLVGEMAREAGINVAVGGNIGVPVLDLLEQPPAELYVLELSSFQLETTESLHASAATVLNISPDHMDRYPSLTAYHSVKHRIYRGCKTAVYNYDDPLSVPLVPSKVSAISFTEASPDLGQFGLKTNSDSVWLYKGLTRLLDTAEMRICGQHNHMNALAALALGEAVGIPLEPMLNAIRRFPGLPHRCQWLAEEGGVRWFNDSKATNVGACIAAIEGLGSQLSGKLVLIAGGEGKGADFSPLCPPVQEYVRHTILLGRDAELIEAQIQGCTEISHVDSLQSAVKLARQVSEEGDAVLLAPACASFDMFKSFEDRGEQFCQQVDDLLKERAPC